MTNSTSADPIDPQPAHARVATSLRKRIQLGVYEPDQRLPTTRALADELGVGRVTLQQAVTLLVDEGLLRTQRGRGGGTFVVGGPGPGRPRKVPPEQLDDLRANYEFRLQIEPFVARMAAERATPESRGALITEAARKSTSVANFRANDSRFHMLLAEACGNRYAKEAIERTRTGLFGWLDRLWAGLTEKSRISEREHMAIALAVFQEEPVEAERLMRAHLEDAVATLTASLGSGQKGEE